MESLQNCLIDCLYDRHWCLLNGIDYVNPDVQKAKEILINKRDNLENKTYKPYNTL